MDAIVELETIRMPIAADLPLAGGHCVTVVDPPTFSNHVC
jgi:hypothetical protein